MIAGATSCMGIGRANPVVITATAGLCSWRQYGILSEGVGHGV